MLKLVEAAEAAEAAAPEALTFAMLTQAIRVGIVLGDAAASEVCRRGYRNDQREFGRMLQLYCERLPGNDFRNVFFKFGPTKRCCFYRLRVVEDGPDRGKLHITIWGDIVDLEDA